MNLVSTTIAGAIGVAVMAGTTQNMRFIAKTQQSIGVVTERDELFRRVTSAVSSEEAMQLTLNDGYNPAFRACVTNPLLCRDGDGGPLAVVNSAGRRVSPNGYSRTFAPCASNCPFSLSTTWTIECAPAGCTSGYVAYATSTFTYAPNLALSGFDERGGTIQKTMLISAKTIHPIRYEPVCTNWVIFPETTPVNTVLAQGTALHPSVLSTSVAAAGADEGGRVRLRIEVDGIEISKVVAQDAAEVARMGGHEWENDYGNASVTIGPGRTWRILVDTIDNQPSGSGIRYCLSRID